MTMANTAGPFEDDLPHGKGTMYGMDDREGGAAANTITAAEFGEFDQNGDGLLSLEETVGRLCGVYGVPRPVAHVTPKLE